MRTTSLILACAVFVCASPGAVRAQSDSGGDTREAAESWDEQGRKTQGTDPNGMRVWYVYDENGVLIEERYADGRSVRHEQTQE